MNSHWLTTLSNDELDQNLRTLQQRTDTAAERDRLQAAVQELQVHQIELEMHNRALREAQGELESSIQRYSDLYENLPIAYLTVNVTGLVRAANRSAHEWLNADKRGLVGRHLGGFADPYDAGRLAAHLENCLRSHDPIAMELTLRPIGLDPIVVQVAGRPALSAPDVEPLVYVAITDVTKLKQAQKILQEINREQEAFNYSISHDLRAPLITINNYAGIVLSDFSAGLGDEGRAMVERIRCAAARMEATLKHLLAYSMLAREEIVLQAVNPEEIVKDILLEHRSLLQEKRAEVKVEGPLPAMRGCDTFLRQVIANLITNAVKYVLEGKTPKIRIYAETRPATVVLKVADEGIGIEPRHHEQIFRIFERLHGYSKYPGSGVGLAIARRAMERMNGRIWVESSPGKGSCFGLELPKA